MLVKARKNSKHKLEHAGPYEITQVNADGTFASRKELSMMQSTSVTSSPFTNESQFQITCLEQDAMNTESTVSLIMGASAAQTRVTVNIAASTDVHGQSATRL
jgi:hypothetical protein